MLKKQDGFTPNKESKNIVLFQNPDSELFQTLNDKLNQKLSSLDASKMHTVHTLENLPMEKVYLLGGKTFEDSEKRDKTLKQVCDIEEETLILLDTFPAESISLAIEKTLYHLYRFNRFKQKDKKDEAVVYYTVSQEHEDAVNEGFVFGEAINNTRELVNTPYNFLNAEKLAEYAKNLERFENIKVRILEKGDCEQLNMGAYLGVNAGSKDAPKFIHVEYENAPDSKEKTALVGKGIMYDTGGYSLKSVKGMPTMKCDMGGAATVLGAIEAIARMGYKANVSVMIAATDNRIGDHAHVPDDILRAASGHTIEIISTDAEGRLTLADALWYAQEKGASRIVDIATLTGGVVAALGTYHTGAFTNNEDFYSLLSQTAKDSNEKIWRLPVDKAHHDTLKSPYADIKNSGGRMAAASVAAAFLETFVQKDIPWIHLDIAGTAYEEKKGASGVMVKTLAKMFA